MSFAGRCFSSNLILESTFIVSGVTANEPALTYRRTECGAFGI